MVVRHSILDAKHRRGYRLVGTRRRAEFQRARVWQGNRRHGVVGGRDSWSGHDSQHARRRAGHIVSAGAHLHGNRQGATRQ